MKAMLKRPVYKSFYLKVVVWEKKCARVVRFQAGVVIANAKAMCTLL